MGPWSSTGRALTLGQDLVREQFDVGVEVVGMFHGNVSNVLHGCLRSISRKSGSSSDLRTWDIDSRVLTDHREIAGPDLHPRLRKRLPQVKCGLRDRVTLEDI
jgi:hypothetical protein